MSKKKINTHPFFIRLNVVYHQKLKEISESTFRTMSEIIRPYVHAGIDEEIKKFEEDGKKIDDKNAKVWADYGKK